MRPDLEELCRIHDIGLDLIERSDNLDDLLDRVLGEYELRLADLRNDTLDGDPEDEGEAKKNKDGNVGARGKGIQSRHEHRRTFHHDPRHTAQSLVACQWSFPQRFLRPQGWVLTRLNAVIASLPQRRSPLIRSPFWARRAPPGSGGSELP